MIAGRRESRRPHPAIITRQYKPFICSSPPPQSIPLSLITIIKHFINEVLGKNLDIFILKLKKSVSKCVLNKRKEFEARCKTKSKLGIFHIDIQSRFSAAELGIHSTGLTSQIYSCKFPYPGSKVRLKVSDPCV